MSKGPKILIIDIETRPIEAYVWQLWDQNVGLNQIKKDWSIMCFAAKWLDKKQVMFYDTQKLSEIYMVRLAWHLLDEADIVVTQNGKAFDIKKLNARFIRFGMKPPSSFQQIDTKRLAKKYFGFTSNSLEYMSDKLNTKYRKLKHDKFPGQELWTECLKGNKQAWKEMKKYNIHDVLATEELYKRLIPWDNSINFNVYYGDKGAVCTCGSTEFRRNGYAYTSTGKYQRFYCQNCRSELKSKQNVLGKQVLRGTKR